MTRNTNDVLRQRPVRDPRIVAGAAVCGSLPATAVAGAAEPPGLDPRNACAALAHEGLAVPRGREGKPTAPCGCPSRPKPLTDGGEPVHGIRCCAGGDATAVRGMTPELTGRLRRDLQRAHRPLAEHAAALPERTLEAFSLPRSTRRSPAA